MALINKIKDNLQLGAPRISVDRHLRVPVDPQELTLYPTLHGGKNGAHISDINIKIQTMQADAHGHPAYGVLTAATYANDGAGWDLRPKQCLTIPLALPLTETQLFDDTALVGFTAHINEDETASAASAMLHPALPL